MNSKLLFKIKKESQRQKSTTRLIAMFENFVYFGEVTKLSSNVYYQMKEVNFSENVFDLMHSRNHYQFVKEIFDADLITNTNCDVDKCVEISKDYKYEFGEEILRKISMFVQLDKNKEFGNDILLIFCSRHDNLLEFVEKLISHGADVHLGEDFALSQACYYGQEKIVKCLLRNGADVNARSGQFLEIAATKGYLEIVKCLIEAGANVKYNLIEFLYIDGYREMAEYLYNAYHKVK